MSGSTRTLSRRKTYACSYLATSLQESQAFWGPTLRCLLPIMWIRYSQNQSSFWQELTYCWQVLYIIPVPLDAATIGDATICCPLVIKRDGDSLICSILPTATTDREMMCCSNKLVSPSFPEAIQRADFTISAPLPTATRGMCYHFSA
jgi:hypothetical protein